jgi:hypothetical protein
VAHPHGLVGREIVEELGLARLELGLPELRRSGALDGTAEVAGHELHAVADAERRDPEGEDLGVELGGAVGVDGCGATGEDQRRRAPSCDLLRCQAVADELRVDTRLPHPPRDELAVLPAEIDDEHGALLRRCLWSRERDDLAHQRR